MSNIEQLGWTLATIHAMVLLHHVFLCVEHKQEVCRQEEFNPHCSYNEVIFISKASYGHLHLGRCIPLDFGHFGCEADVSSLVDIRCSGKRTCSLPIVDPELEDAQPECAIGLGSFLEVSHFCIAGKSF